MNLKSLLLTTCLALATTPLFTACQVSHKTKSESDNLSKATEAYNNGNYQEAAKLFEKSCNGGVAESCFGLGLLYDKGQGVKQDYAQAAKWYEQACNGGMTESCHNLGILYEEAQGVKQDYVQATKLYEQSCNGGVAVSCIKMATMYAKGQGVKEDSELAMSYMKKACDLGQADVCYALQQEQKEKNRGCIRLAQKIVKFHTIFARF